MALLRVFPEEKWTSMDLVADELALALGRQQEFVVEGVHAQFQRASLPVRQLAMANRLVNRAWDYPRWLKGRVRNYDLFHVIDHSYANLALVTPPGRTVVTCHDLDAFRSVLEPDKDPRPGWFRRYSQRLLDGLKQAGHVCFVSDTVRQEALRFGIVDVAKTSVVPNGVNRVFAEGGSAADVARIEELLAGVAGKTLILHVGSTIPRKRIDVLLRILAALPEVVLVRVGGKLNPAQAALAQELGVAGRIVTMPFLSTGELASLYRRCEVTVQCSESEGFGLPVAEALVSGCPVVATDLPVLREVGGEAALFCALEEIDEWKSLILQVLAMRREAGEQWKLQQEKMSAIAVLFSWDRAAHSTVAIYKTLLNNSN